MLTLLFTFVSVTSSTSRILLQVPPSNFNTIANQPNQQTPNQPQIPQFPGAAQPPPQQPQFPPVAPQNPPVAVQPQPQPQPQQPQPNPPVAVPPQQPVNPPVAPQQPKPKQPTIPTGIPNQMHYQTEMICNLPNTSPLGCAGKATMMKNPPLDFKLICGGNGMGQCAKSDFYFDFGVGMVERIELMNFETMWAAWGATITLDSCSSANGQYIDVIECKEPHACEDLTIQLLCGASVNDIKCEQEQNCMGCKIMENCTKDVNGKVTCIGPGKLCWGY